MFLAATLLSGVSGLSGCSGGGGETGTTTTPPGTTPPPVTPPDTTVGTLVLPYYSYNSMAAPATLGFWDVAKKALVEQWDIRKETTPRLVLTYAPNGTRTMNGVITAKDNRLLMVGLPGVTSKEISSQDNVCETNYFQGGFNHAGYVVAEFAGTDQLCDKTTDNPVEYIDLQSGSRKTIAGRYSNWEVVLSRDYSTAEGILSNAGGKVSFYQPGMTNPVVIGDSAPYSSIDYELDEDGNIFVINNANIWVGKIDDLQSGNAGGFTYVKAPLAYSYNIRLLTDKALFVRDQTKIYRMDRASLTFTLVYDAATDLYNSEKIASIDELYAINDRLFITAETVTQRKVTLHLDASTPWITGSASTIAGEGFSWRTTVMDEQFFYFASVVSEGGNSFCEARIMNGNGEVVSRFANAQWMVAFTEDPKTMQTPLLAVGTTSNGDCQLYDPTIYRFDNGTQGKDIGMTSGWTRSIFIGYTENNVGLATVFKSTGSPSLRVLGLDGNTRLSSTVISPLYHYPVF
jgi:hypothetical protein